MELRTLRYFLALAQEGTISNAAKALHVTQPTLSRQLADLEKGFGKQLFERGAKRVALTEEGARLREYAESIVELADKAEAELSQPEKAVSGDVYIGCGESDAMRIILRAAEWTRRDHPLVHYHLFSGTSADLAERFDGGLLDFMVEFELTGRPDCLTLTLPAVDTLGVLMRADDPLAQQAAVRPADLAGRPLIGSRQGIKSGKMMEWAGDGFEEWDVVATYNLLFNGALMVEEGIGVRHLLRSARQRLRGRPVALPSARSAVDLGHRRRLEEAPPPLARCGRFPRTPAGRGRPRGVTFEAA